MAEHAVSSIDVDASADELFDIVTDLENYPEWISGMKEIEVHEVDKNGVPIRATMTIDASVKTVTYTLKYEYERPGRLSWVSEEGGDLKLVEGSYTFEVNDDGGTTVTYDLTIDPGFSIPGFMLRKAQKVIMKSGLNGLKKYAES